MSVLAKSFEAVKREMLLSVTTTHHVLYPSHSLSQAQSSGGFGGGTDSHSCLY